MVQIFLVSLLLCASVRKSSANTTDSASTLPVYLLEENQTALNCTLIALTADHYQLLANGSVLVGGPLMDESFYVLKGENITTCESYVKQTKATKIRISKYITDIGYIVSMICLFLHLVVFCMVRDLRNLPGWNLAALCVCLFMTYLLSIVIFRDYVYILKESDTCEVLAWVYLFCYFSSVLWMSVILLDVFMCLLRATGCYRISSTHFSKRKFGLYCLCAFGISLLFCIMAVLADTLKVVPEEYRPQFRIYCWFSRYRPMEIFFYGPVIFLWILNLFLFLAASCVIHVNKRKCDQDAQQPSKEWDYLVYLRLSVFMGVTRFLHVAAIYADLEWLLIICAFLNSFQGLLVFLAFTCSKKVKKHFRQKLSGDRESSDLTLNPTFQSYCAYTNSVEDDLGGTAETTN